MAVESRNDGRQRYFYRKKRVGGKVISEYVGGSEFDFMLAEWKENDRKIARHEKNMREIEPFDLEAFDRKLDALEADLNELITAYLTGAGFYKTSSREWRYKQSD